VVEHDNLCSEVSDTGGGLILRIRGNVSSLDVLDGDVLNVESDVVTGKRYSVSLSGAASRRITLRNDETDTPLPGNKNRSPTSKGRGAAPDSTMRAGTGN